MADKQSSVYKTELGKSVSNDDRNKFVEIVNVPNKGDKNKITPQNGTGSDRPVLTDMQGNLRSGIRQTAEEYKENEAYEKIRALEEHNKLCKVMCCLHETILELLRRKMKLMQLSSQIFQNDLINSINEVQLKVKEALARYFTECGVSKNAELHKIQKIIESSTNEQIVKEMTDDLEEIVKEIEGSFLQYKVVYKKCKSVLETYFKQNIEGALKIKNKSRTSAEKQSAYFSVLEYISSHTVCLETSMKTSEEFEILIKHLMKIPGEDIERRIELFLAAIHKAESSCNDLKSFASVLFNFEFAKV